MGRLAGCICREKVAVRGLVSSPLKEKRETSRVGKVREAKTVWVSATVASPQVSSISVVSSPQEKS